MDNEKALPIKAIEQSIEILRQGGLVAIPTETVYGLAADADNEKAVMSIYAAKGRPADHPLIVHVSSAEALNFWCKDIPPEVWLLVQRYWPGPLTIVLKKNDRCGLWVTGGQDSVALRCPSHPITHELLKRFAGPTHKGLTAPSANTFGRISPSSAQHVADDLGLKPEGKLDMILDGGLCEFGLESTIINLSDGHPSLLRHGVITRAMLEETLGFEVPDAGKDAPRASGRLKSHYAPKTRLELIGATNLPIVLLSLPVNQLLSWRQNKFCRSSKALPSQLPLPKPYKSTDENSMKIYINSMRMARFVFSWSVHLKVQTGRLSMIV